MAVSREVGARDAAGSDDGQRSFDVLPQTSAIEPTARGRKKGHRLVEQRRILARDQVARQAEQRPEDDVAVRIAGTQIALALEEREPLRPVAVRVLRGKDAQQQVTHRLRAAQRQQHLERSLADVARAPSAARILLEPARRQVMHQRVVQVPGQNVGQACHVARQGAVGRHRPLWQRNRVDRGGARTDQTPDDAQAERSDGSAGDADEGLAARGAVAEQQFIATHALESASRQGTDAEPAAPKPGRQAAALWNTD